MKHSLSLASRLRIPDGILSHNLQGEEVVLNLNNGVYWGLDAVGTRTWALLQENRRLDSIYEIMREEYEVSEERLRQDLLNFMAQLVDNGLVEVVSATVG